MITMKELNPKKYEVDEDVQASLEHLLEVLNTIRAAYGKPMYITSGLRSEADQKRINPKASKSKHLLGQAADIRDSDGKFWDWCMQNIALMEELGVYFESNKFTMGWVHAQTVPPKSGRRIFIP